MTVLFLQHTIFLFLFWSKILVLLKAANWALKKKRNGHLPITATNMWLSYKCGGSFEGKAFTCWRQNEVHVDWLPSLLTEPVNASLQFILGSIVKRLRNRKRKGKKSNHLTRWIIRLLFSTRSMWVMNAAQPFIFKCSPGLFGHSLVLSRAVIWFIM